ncbi:MAG: TIGR00282 family metallophosphoesterase [Candidatus Omnitrophica bacterium]|nr:TIGR00282 family metallophosphoesterase [Candidatus Omnitrophota bacterium]MDD5672014.1 TIGR00282 family metallophosphoesterase [Candidatus Omnitrophota bacterium]
MKLFRVLVIGDVVGKPGRKACEFYIRRLKSMEKIDFVIANVENVAGGSGITESSARELFQYGVDVMTSGDHIFKKKEVITILKDNHKILRPANYPAGVPGCGGIVVESMSGIKVGVLNLMGRVFLKPVDCPFEAARRELEGMRKETPVIFVDIHAEATSEKIALGWFLDGRVSAVFGTHTHVQTADEQILPHGTGYITDLGMCGPYRSVIGREVDPVIEHFLTQMPVHMDVATGDVRLAGAIFDIDPETGKTVQVRRVMERIPDGTE